MDTCLIHINFTDLIHIKVLIFMSCLLLRLYFAKVGFLFNEHYNLDDNSQITLLAPVPMRANLTNTVYELF